MMTLNAPTTPCAPSLTRLLARRLAGPVTAADRTRAALHVLDWAGCAVIGRATPAGRMLDGFGSMFGPGGCTGVGRVEGLSPTGAAFVNGGLGNVLEMDDIHRTSILHPGPVVIPAAFAAAQARRVGPHAFLDAVVRGYEAVIRIGSAVGAGHYALWHNTSTCGPFGSAAAVASVAGLDEEATVWALGSAGTQAAGPWRMRHERVMSKQLHTARAAEAGFAAAELASLGFTGPEFILEGAQGFFAAMAPEARPEAVTADLDAPWRIWDVSFKPWAACRHAHPALDAALALRAMGVRAEAVTGIQVDTYADAVRFCDRAAPETELEAKFSLQHAVAVALTDGPPTLAHFRPDAAARPDLAALCALATVAVADPWDAAFPHRYGAAVTVRLMDGRAMRAEAPDALGDPDNPVAPARLIAKARELCLAAGRSDAQTDRLIDATLSLPEAPDLTAFAAALAETPAGPPA